MTNAHVDEYGRVCSPNPLLLSRQGIFEPDRVSAIAAAQAAMTTHVVAMNAMAPDDPGLHEMAEDIERQEFELQDLWGFPRSRAHHIHWRRPRACSCPRHANDDLFGEPRRIVQPTCPLHGGRTVEGIEIVDALPSSAGSTIAVPASESP